MGLQGHPWKFYSEITCHYLTNKRKRKKYMYTGFLSLVYYGTPKIMNVSLLIQFDINLSVNFFVGTNINAALILEQIWNYLGC